MAAIHDMIVGLAEFEMEPDAVTATPADLHEALSDCGQRCSRTLPMMLSTAWSVLVLSLIHI